MSKLSTREYTVLAQAADILREHGYPAEATHVDDARSSLAPIEDLHGSERHMQIVHWDGTPCRCFQREA